MGNKQLIGFLLVILLVFIFPNYVKADSTLDFLSTADVLDVKQCLKYTCKPFACVIKKDGVPLPGDRICHNVPVAFVETVTGSFTTIVPFVGQVLSVLSQSILQQSGGAEQKGDTYLHFFEAHVFTVPTEWLLKLKVPFLRLCSYSSENMWSLHYLSEVDSVNWRTGISDILSIKTLIGGTLDRLVQICSVTSAAGRAIGDVCMGTWGATYPRTGFSNANSEPVASAIAAYRASRVVAMPWGRVVFVPRNFSAGVQMQLGYPKFGKPKNCFPAGTTPASWDNFTTKPPKGQGYLWVLWERVCCCKRPPGCVLPVGI